MMTTEIKKPKTLHDIPPMKKKIYKDEYPYDLKCRNLWIVTADAKSALEFVYYVAEVENKRVYVKSPDLLS